MSPPPTNHANDSPRPSPAVERGTSASGQEIAEVTGHTASVPQRSTSSSRPVRLATIAHAGRLIAVVVTLAVTAILGLLLVGSMFSGLGGVANMMSDDMAVS